MCSCYVLSLLYYFFLYWGDCQCYVFSLFVIALVTVLLCLATYRGATYVVPELNSMMMMMMIIIIIII